MWAFIERIATMDCPKCGSLMFPCAPLQYAALFDTAQLHEEPTFHCVICGQYVDRTILRNRAAQDALVLA